MNPACVITSIFNPTVAVKMHADNFALQKGVTYVVGDRKTPADWECAGVKFVAYGDDPTSLKLPSRLPCDHYARKNIGYLLAMRNASVIYDTDDDNEPLPSWAIRNQSVYADTPHANGWVNTYAWFTREKIWPRGYPLSCISDSQSLGIQSTGMQSCVIQQGLADKHPDVDAVWRLTNDRDFHFQHERRSVALRPYQWCPFNSQSTWWFPPAFALMYLPSYCSFRMTDIWRGFIALRCLWQTPHTLCFHAPPEVIQRRNSHVLIKDFEEEVPGYLKNTDIANALDAIPLSPDVPVWSNMYACYEALVSAGIFPSKELELLALWIDDVSVQLRYRAAV